MPTISAPGDPVSQPIDFFLAAALGDQSQLPVAVPARDDALEAQIQPGFRQPLASEIGAFRQRGRRGPVRAEQSQQRGRRLARRGGLGLSGGAGARPSRAQRRFPGVFLQPRKPLPDQVRQRQDQGNGEADLNKTQ